MLNLPRVSFESFRFAEPLYLWLLIIPAVLFAVWIWRFVRRRGDLKRLRADIDALEAKIAGHGAA